MKRRITALLLCGCLCGSMLCFSAFGAGVSASYSSGVVTVSGAEGGVVYTVMQGENVVALDDEAAMQTGTLANGSYTVKVYDADGKLIGQPASFTVSSGSGSSGGSSGGSSSKPKPTTPEAETTPGGFSDTKGHWAGEAIQYVVDNGLFKGTSTTTFSPEEPMTRAMLTTVLYRYAKEPAAPAAAPFTDVPAGQYYTDSVTWASNRGIVNGVGGGKFNPDGNIIRQDLATMLYRSVGSPAVTGEVTGFGDAAKISAYAKDAMLWATQQGILAGDNHHNLNPGSNATRAEVATMVMRFAKLSLTI